MDQPAYSKSDFVGACKAGDRVIVADPALTSAASDFSLRSKKEILDFIGNNGLASAKLKNSRPYEKWKAKPPAPMVDAYRFTSGDKQGYIAFYRGFDGAWIIKSFKQDAQQNAQASKVDLKSTELTFKGLSGLAKLLKQREKPEEKDDGK